jgi:hypothetical protein
MENPYVSEERRRPGRIAECDALEFDPKTATKWEVGGARHLPAWIAACKARGLDPRTAKKGDVDG